MEHPPQNSSVSSVWHARAVVSTVFVTGAVSLMLEVLAVRVLSPYFGSTIYTVSSIIAVTLGGLSLGYYLGGRMADRSVSEKTFYRMVLMAGLAIPVFAILPRYVLAEVSMLLPLSLSLTIGPLITSLFLFALPSVMLGLLSPYAVVLLRSLAESRGVGSVTGKVFFISTVGSIVGSLSAGFILIPHVGVGTSLWLISGMTVVLGLLGSIYTARFTLPQTAVLFALALAVGGYVVSVSKLSDSGEGIVFSKDGVYSKIVVRDTLWDDTRMARILLLDRSFSSARYLDNLGGLPFEYTNYYSLANNYGVTVKKAAVLGAGTLTIPSALVSGDSRLTVDAVDIEPELPEIAKKYFNYVPNERIHPVLADARQFLTRESEHTYDLIFTDVYQSYLEIPPQFVTKEFFELAKSRLSEGGILMANVVSSIDGSAESTGRSIVATMASVFDHVDVYAVQDPVHPSNFQNYIVIGVPDSLMTFRSEPSVVQFSPYTAYVAHKIPTDALNLTLADTFSDDYAPVEYRLGRELAASVRQAEGK